MKYRLTKLAARQSEIAVSCVQTSHCLHKSFCLYFDVKFKDFINYPPTKTRYSDAVIRQFDRLINAYA